MLKILLLIVVEKIYIKCNIWRVTVRPSNIKDAGFLKVKKDSAVLGRYLANVLSYPGIN
jgi:hypothetical protein